MFERTYPQMEFMQGLLQNPDIANSALDILIKQCNKLKYGSEDFVCGEQFVLDFYEQFDTEYHKYVDTDESLDRLGFKVKDAKQ